MKRALERQERWEKQGLEGEADLGAALGAGEAGGGVGEAAPAPRAAATSLRPVPDPEVAPKAQRRRFTASYKLRILAEAEHCTSPGEIGALLRREGLYNSHLSKWRALHRQGGAAALGRPRGRKPDADTALREQVRRLERDNQRLQRALQQAEAIIEVQKKLSEVLGISLATPREDDETSA